MKTAEIYKKHISNFGNDYEYYVVIFYNGIPEDVSRYCHTYEEALDWAKTHNAKVEEENKWFTIGNFLVIIYIK